MEAGRREESDANYGGRCRGIGNESAGQALKNLRGVQGVTTAGSLRALDAARDDSRSQEHDDSQREQVGICSQLVRVILTRQDRMNANPGFR